MNLVLYFDENIPEDLARGIQNINKPYFYKNKQLQINLIVSEFHQGIQDEEIYSKIGTKECLLVTNDFKMKRQYYDIIRKSNVGVYFIKYRTNSSYWERVEMTIKCWETINEHSEHKKPFSCELSQKKGKIVSNIKCFD